MALLYKVQACICLIARIADFSEYRSLVFFLCCSTCENWSLGWGTSTRLVWLCICMWCRNLTNEETKDLFGILHNTEKRGSTRSLSLGVLICYFTNASFAIRLRICIYFRVVLILSTIFSLSCKEELIQGGYHPSFKQYSVWRTRRLCHEHNKY